MRIKDFSNFRVEVGDFADLEAKKSSGEVSIDEYNKIFSESRFHGINNNVFPFAVGGSDAAIILGLSRWKSPLDLYRLKKRLSREIISEQQKLIFEIGHQYETPVRELFSYTSGIKTESCTVQFMNKKYPNLVANIDGLCYIVDENGNTITGLYEGKTTKFGSAIWESFIKGICPVEYYIQVQFYLEILDLEYAYINCACGFDPNKESIYLRIDRNSEIGELICQECQAFVDAAKKGNIPNNRNCQNTKLRIMGAIKTSGRPDKKLPKTILDPKCKSYFDTLIACDNEIETINENLIKLKSDPAYSLIESKIEEEKEKLKGIKSRKDGAYAELLSAIKNTPEGYLVDNNTQYVFRASDRGFSVNKDVKNYIQRRYPDVYKDISELNPLPPICSYEVIPF